MSPRTTFVLASLVAGSLLAATNGCATINGALPFIGKKAEAPQSGPTCAVIINGKETELAITDQTRIQDVLEATRAIDKYRRLNVYVLRQSNRDPRRTVKLAAKYDAGERRVSLETDYAILPGDRVVISRDTSSQFDKALGAMFGLSGN